MRNHKHLHNTDPETILSHFKNEEEFEKWLDKGSKQEIELVLEEFVNAELFNVCKIIKSYLING